MSKLYIAYGSNLSVDQMAYRCPDAKVAGMAALQDWKLVFRLHATIEPASGRTVPVLVWEISEEDEKRLDRYEGYPRYYFKQNMEITMLDLDGKNPRKVVAMVYLMTTGREIELPMKSYYGVIAEGYERFGFNPYILHSALREAKEVRHAFSRT